MSNTPSNHETLWQLPPEVQASLDAANARLAALAQQHAPAVVSLPPRLAQDLVAWGEFKLKPKAAAMLSPRVSSADFFAQLIEHGCLADARRVLSHSLPKRRALWWAALAIQDAYRDDMPTDLRTVLQATTQFVVTPSEDQRRVLGELSSKIAANTVAGCLASAAFFSSGSVTSVGLPPVAPKPFITGRLVGVCVYLASVHRSARHYKQYLREYLRWGQAIARGEMLWPEGEVEPITASRLDQYWQPTRPHLSVAASSNSTVGASS